MSWLTTLLAKELWLGDVLRLWGESGQPVLFDQLTAYQMPISQAATCLHCIAMSALLYWRPARSEQMYARVDAPDVRFSGLWKNWMALKQSSCSLTFHPWMSIG